MEADMGRVAVFNFVSRRWQSGPLSGMGWEHSRKPLDIEEGDNSYATVRVARNKKPESIEDAQALGRAQPPNTWVRGCLVLPLVGEDGHCDTVVTLWHHVVGWFSQFDSKLLEVLVALGGAWARIPKAIEVREAREQEAIIKSLAKHIAHSLNSQIPLESFTDLVGFLEKTPHKQDAEKCVLYVKSVRRMSRRFMWLSDLTCFAHDPHLEAEDLFQKLKRGMGELVRDVNLVHGANKILLGSCVSGGLSGSVACNSTSLQDDITELLVNTSKHAASERPTGRPVTVALEMRNASESDLMGSEVLGSSVAKGNYVVIEYRDDGLGIAPEKRAGMFDLKTGASLKERTTSSLGLGLPLARTLARKLGGDLIEVGGPGDGVRFMFFFVRHP